MNVEQLFQIYYRVVKFKLCAIITSEDFDRFMELSGNLLKELRKNLTDIIFVCEKICPDKLVRKYLWPLTFMGLKGPQTSQ